ncbi:MAG: hypothetical protein Q4E70_02215 [Candidatus Saccharibacteria bacterium]|nr:hypothetical protein [Candidatus Saccharibacteria bacterium]
MKCESKLIVNATDRKVIAYNSEGSLIELFPVDKIMEYPQNVSNKALLVDESFYQSLDFDKRRLTEYVKMSGKPSVGRDGIKIHAFTSWDRKDEDDEPIRIYPESIDFYQRFDPNGLIHRFLDNIR